MNAAELLELTSKRTEDGQYATVPAFGVVVGGHYDGWRFKFERFHVEHGRIDGAVSVEVVVSDPFWPFPNPKRIRLAMGGSEFRSLNAVAGERPKRLPIRTLVLDALRTANPFATEDA